MAVDCNNMKMSGEALVNQGSHTTPYTIDDYLFGIVNFDIPVEAMKSLLLKRDIEPGTVYAYVEQKDKDLLEADIYVWIATGASRVGGSSDSDNGWTHTTGGHTLTEEDKKRLLSKANVIYEQYGEPSTGKTKIKINSFGVMRANQYVNGEYIPHNIL